MIKYEGFNLPADGLTRVVEIGDYGARDLHTEGWIMVGMAEAGEKLYGVYRKNTDKALEDALASAKKGQEEQSKLQSKVWELENKNKELTKQAAQAIADSEVRGASAKLLFAARERFGAAFLELEKTFS